MEFPDLGKHCSSKTCNKLDFLPMKCDACSEIFCKDHIQYLTHQCPNSYQRDVQVPVCPLCNQPVPVKRGEAPDIRVGEHIDRDCQSDPAMAKRKVYTSKCSQKGCKQKEMIKIACPQCRLNYCLKHRFPQDHNCQGLMAAGRSISNSGTAAMARSQASGYKSTQPSIRPVAVTNNGPLHQQPRSRTTVVAVQGSLSEDEALARALQMSLMDNSTPVTTPNSQYEADRQLAEALALSQRQQRRTATPRNNSSCSLS